MANYTVSGNRKDGYNVRRDNATRVSLHTDTKKEAEASAKDLSAKSGGGEVRIQSSTGKFVDSDTVAPGNDPHPPTDKKH